MKNNFLALIFIFCLGIPELVATPQEREALVKDLSGIYFNPDPSKKIGDVKYKEEQVVDFLINLYSADKKALVQIFEHAFFKKCELDLLTLFILEKKNLVHVNDIVLLLKQAFELCRKIAKNYTQEYAKRGREIILSPDNIIYIFMYAFVKFKNKYEDPSSAATMQECRARRKETLSGMELSFLVPMVKVQEIRSFEEILAFISSAKTRKPKVSTNIHA